MPAVIQRRIAVWYACLYFIFSEIVFAGCGVHCLSVFHLFSFPFFIFIWSGIGDRQRSSHGRAIN